MDWSDFGRGFWITAGVVAALLIAGLVAKAVS
jgi:hypothetical protein